MSTDRNYMPAVQWASEITLLGKSMAEQWKVVHVLTADAITFYHRSKDQDVTRIQELNHVLQMNNANMRSALLSVLAKTTGVSFKQTNANLAAPMEAKHSGKKMNKALEEHGAWQDTLDALDKHAEGLKSETEFKKAKAAAKGNAQDNTEGNGEVKEGLGVLGDTLLGKDGHADAITALAAKIADALRQADITPSAELTEAFVDTTVRVAGAVKINDEQSAIAALNQCNEKLHTHLKALFAQAAT